MAEKLSLFVILAIAAGVLASTHPPDRIAESRDDLLVKHSEVSPSKDREPSFFPVAVWYGGGKARAAMLETVTPDSPKLWKEDLSKIKELGFNAVRTWVEWNVGEPEEGKCHLENLDLLLRLANEVGLKVMVQVYVDSAPEWVGKMYPEGRYAAQDGRPIPSQAAPGYVELERVLEKSASSIREIVTGEKISPAGTDLNSIARVPAQSVRIYPIDF